MKREKKVFNSIRNNRQDYSAETLYLLLWLRTREEKLTDISIALPIDNTCDRAVVDNIQLHQRKTCPLIIPYYLALSKEPRWLGLMVTWDNDQVSQVLVIDTLNVQISLVMRELQASFQQAGLRQVNIQLISPDNSIDNPRKSGAIIVEQLIHAASHGTSFKQETFKTGKGKKGKRKGKKPEKKEKAKLPRSLIKYTVAQDIAPIYEKHRTLLQTYDSNKRRLFRVQKNTASHGSTQAITSDLDTVTSVGLQPTYTKDWSLSECRQITRMLMLINFLEDDVSELKKKLENYDGLKEKKTGIHEAMKICAKQIGRRSDADFNQRMFQALFQLLYSAVNEKEEFLNFKGILKNSVSHKNLRLSKRVLKKIGDLLTPPDESNEFTKEYIRQEKYHLQRLTSIEKRFSYEKKIEALCKGIDTIGPLNSNKQHDLLLNIAEMGAYPNFLVVLLNDIDLPDQLKRSLQNIVQDAIEVLKEKGDAEDIKAFLVFARLRTDMPRRIGHKNKEIIIHLFDALVTRLISSVGRTHHAYYQGLSEFVVEVMQQPYANFISNTISDSLHTVAKTLAEAGVVSTSEGAQRISYFQLKTLIVLLNYIKILNGSVSDKTRKLLQHEVKTGEAPSVLAKLKKNGGILNVFLVEHVEQLLVRTTEAVQEKSTGDRLIDILKVSTPILGHTIGVGGAVASMVLTAGISAPIFLPRAATSTVAILTPLFRYLRKPDKVEQKNWYDRLATVNHIVTVIAQTGHKLIDWQDLMCLLTDKGRISKYTDEGCLLSLVDTMSFYYRTLPKGHPQRTEIRIEILKFFGTSLNTTKRFSDHLFILAHLRYLLEQHESAQDARNNEAYSKCRKLYSTYSSETTLKKPRAKGDKTVSKVSKFAKKSVAQIKYFKDQGYFKKAFPSNGTEYNQALSAINRLLKELKLRDEWQWQKHEEVYTSRFISDALHGKITRSKTAKSPSTFIKVKKNSTVEFGCMTQEGIRVEVDDPSLLREVLSAMDPGVFQKVIEATQSVHQDDRESSAAIKKFKNFEDMFQNRIFIEGGENVKAKLFNNTFRGFVLTQRQVPSASSTDDTNSDNKTKKKREKEHESHKSFYRR